MDKKGQGLTLNTIIVAILVILVLVVLVAFFLGGSTGLTNSVKKVFFGTQAGVDKTTALQICNQRCDQIDILVSGKDPKAKAGDSKLNAYQKAVKSSAFCNTPFNIDTKNTGEADTDEEGKTIDYYCQSWGIDWNDAKDSSLDASCEYSCASGLSN